MKHLIIYGPEGSGKGTQALLLGKKLNLPVLTSGDLVREAAANDKSRLGDICRAALTEGRYVPDAEIFTLWEQKLRSPDAIKGFILDGFPRNKNQTEFLFKTIEPLNFSIDRLIYINISDEEAIKRLSKRHRAVYEGSTDNHDSPERVSGRLSIYRKQEKDLLEFFRERNLLQEIDGLGTVDEVSARILNGLKVSLT